MAQLGWPTIFCHDLQVVDDRIVGYRLRLTDQKRRAVEAFQCLGFRVVAGRRLLQRRVDAAAPPTRACCSAPRPTSRAEFPQLPAYRRLRRPLRRHRRRARPVPAGLIACGASAKLASVAAGRLIGRDAACARLEALAAPGAVGHAHRARRRRQDPARPGGARRLGARDGHPAPSPCWAALPDGADRTPSPTPSGSSRWTPPPSCWPSARRPSCSTTASTSLGAAREVVRELRGAVPHGAVLATSREPLGVAGEQVVVVGPARRCRRAGGADAEDVAGGRAVPRAGGGRRRRARADARRCSPTSPSCAAASTACRWPSSWPRPAPGPSRLADLLAVVDQRLDLLRRLAGRRATATTRCGPRSRSRPALLRRTSARSSAASACSPGRSTSALAHAVAGEPGADRAGDARPARRARRALAGDRRGRRRGHPLPAARAAPRARPSTSCASSGRAGGRRGALRRGDGRRRRRASSPRRSSRWEPAMLARRAASTPTWCGPASCASSATPPRPGLPAAAADVRRRPRGPPRRGVGARLSGSWPAGPDTARRGGPRCWRCWPRRRRSPGAPTTSGRWRPSRRRRPGGQPGRRRARRPGVGAGRPRPTDPAAAARHFELAARRRRRGPAFASMAREVAAFEAGELDLAGDARRGPRPAGRRRCAAAGDGRRRVRRRARPPRARPGSGCGPATSTPRRPSSPRPTRRSAAMGQPWWTAAHPAHGGRRRLVGPAGGRRRARWRRGASTSPPAAGRSARSAITLRAAAATVAHHLGERRGGRGAVRRRAHARRRSPCCPSCSRERRAGASSAAGGDPRPPSAAPPRRRSARCRRTAAVQRPSRRHRRRSPPASTPSARASWSPRATRGASTFAGRTVRVRDMKGIGDLAVLVARPGAEVHALELMGGHDVGGGGRAGPRRRARRAYQERIVELQRDIDEARGRPRRPAGRAGRARARRAGRAAQRGVRARRAGPDDRLERRAGPHRRHVPGPRGDPQAVRAAPRARPPPHQRRAHRHVVLVPARDRGALDDRAACLTV